MVVAYRLNKSLQFLEEFCEVKDFQSAKTQMKAHQDVQIVFHVIAPAILLKKVFLCTMNMKIYCLD